jgi:hypothetical protein
MTTFNLKPKFALIDVAGPEVLEAYASGKKLPYEGGSVVTQDYVLVAYQEMNGRKELFACAISGNPDDAITALNDIAQSAGIENRAYRPEFSEVTVKPAAM